MDERTDLWISASNKRKSLALAFSAGFGDSPSLAVTAWPPQAVSVFSFEPRRLLAGGSWRLLSGTAVAGITQPALALAGPSTRRRGSGRSSVLYLRQVNLPGLSWKWGDWSLSGIAHLSSRSSGVNGSK